ncbi:MAG TPA: 50S ribosomal protein L25 [Anaerolineales bacterium]|nr:50S ribosomal protein L25 [Anaerolineales bacterium]
MENRVLSAQPRKMKGKQVGALRRSGSLPGILYGRGTEPIAIEMEASSAARVLEVASASTLLDLQLNGETHKVLVRELQRHPIRRTLDHVDLMKVALDVAIRTTVPIELIGEAVAVKTFGGVLVTGISAIDVEALPADLPSRVTVDLEPLATMDARITVGDLFLGKGVRVLSDPQAVVARVIYQVEEKLEEVVAPVSAVPAEPEIIGRGKKEEEVEEGAEAKPGAKPAAKPAAKATSKND